MLKAMLFAALVAAFSLFAQVGSASPDVAVYAATDYSALAPPIADMASANLTAINSMFGTEPQAIAVIAYSGHIAAAPQRQDFP